VFHNLLGEVGGRLELGIKDGNPTIKQINWFRWTRMSEGGKGGGSGQHSWSGVKNKEGNICDKREKRES